MGGSSSRKVSFGVGEGEKIHVLRGVRLSDDLINRMKDSSYASYPAANPPLYPPEGKAQLPRTEPRLPVAEGDQSPSKVEDQLYKRYEEERGMIREELFRLAKREREMAREHRNMFRQQKESCVNQEKQSNAEIYKLSSQQFHEAATQAESSIKPRSIEPVCGVLQSEILRCYRKNKEEVLKCSNLAKAYQQCVIAAREVRISPRVSRGISFDPLSEHHLCSFCAESAGHRAHFFWAPASGSPTERPGREKKSPFTDSASSWNLLKLGHLWFSPFLWSRAPRESSHLLTLSQRATMLLGMENLTSGQPPSPPHSGFSR
uniref:Coiled-coil-helix-coiled-coil-helix domain containing 6 n=1 Tax=Ornithorhynchus anatinus TaxID=9258 RepID=A0A6I8PI87_ORNAN